MQLIFQQLFSALTITFYDNNILPFFFVCEAAALGNVWFELAVI